VAGERLISEPLKRQPMNSYEIHLAGDKKCIFCGAQGDSVQLLNTRAECKGGVESYYFRCGQCRQYFVEYWINGELKTVLAS
jgi:hypothetical protein